MEASAAAGTAQHSTAQHSTAQHSTAQHSTAQHSTAQHSTAQHRALCYSSTRCTRYVSAHTAHCARACACVCAVCVCCQALAYTEALIDFGEDEGDVTDDLYPRALEGVQQARNKGGALHRIWGGGLTSFALLAPPHTGAVPNGAPS